MKIGPVLVLGVVVIGSTAVIAPAPKSTDYVSIHDACSMRGGRYFDEIVRVRWTPVRTTDGIDVLHCVLRGKADAELPFLRDAEHLVFTAVSNGANERWLLLRFNVRTSAGREILMDSVRVRLAAFGQPSCALDLCELFTEPGERVRSVDAEVLHVGRPIRRQRHYKPKSKRRES